MSGSQTTACESQRGFTIIELMIVITIIGVLAAVAIPAFDSLIKNNRRTTVVNELVSNLMLARAEAAKRGQAVTVCGNTSSGGISCTGGTNWDYGWMVFLDPPSTPPPSPSDEGNGAIASADDMLRKFVNDYPDIRVRTSTGGTGFITQWAFSRRADNVSVILVCDKRGNAESRRICIDKNGRSHTSTAACSNTDTLTCP